MYSMYFAYNVWAIQYPMWPDTTGIIDDKYMS